MEEHKVRIFRGSDLLPTAVFSQPEADPQASQLLFEDFIDLLVTVPPVLLEE
jgi:hypothetical protein